MKLCLQVPLQLTNLFTMSMSTTEINNQTTFPLKVQVTHSVYKSDLTIVKAGGKYVIDVDFNGTYREFVMGVNNNNSMKNLMVSSDDLCDNKSITITEEDGELQVHKESRHEAFDSTSTTTSSTSALPFVDKICHWIRAQTQKVTPRNTRNLHELT